MKNSVKKFIPKFLWNFAKFTKDSSIYFFDTLGPYIRSRNYCGVRVYYNKGNALIKRLKKEPIFEKEMCQAIVREIRDNSLFVDIGANIGLISLYVQSKIPNSTIHAFEPGVVQRELLNKTVKENSLKKIFIHGEALGDKMGAVTFHIHEPRYAALDGIHDTLRRGSTKQIEVPMITLDSWWMSAGKPLVSVIKIDTEGAELLVLKGAEHCIQENKPVIFLEIEPLNLRVYDYTKSDIFDFFTRAGYRIEALNRDTYIARV